MARERPLIAAGAVTWRRAAPRPQDSGRPVELLLVHRPQYDDWSFPKGKPDEGEDLVTTAVREVAEETGQVVRLGAPLPDTTYQVARGTKRVAYWAARVVEPTPVPFAANDEIDKVRWARPDQARALLTHDHDVDLLESFLKLRDDKGHRSRTLVVLRHAKATARDGWPGADPERPLTASGTQRAIDLVPLLAGYGVRRMVSSPAVRCTDTVDPYARSIGAMLCLDDRLGEDAGRSAVRRCVESLIDRKSPVALCGHRPTLPWVFDTLGLDPPELAPGEGIVVHHRRGRIIATEQLGRPVEPR